MSKEQQGQSDSVAIAVRSSTDMAALDELEQILLGLVEPPELVDDPQEISREIIAQLLAAESDEELETVGGAIGWRELEGVPVEIRGFRWRRSSYEQGSPVFFVVQGTRLDTGEPVILTTGSGNVLAQLANLARRGRLPGAIRAIRKLPKPTASGYYPLMLVTPEGAKEAAA